MTEAPQDRLQDAWRDTLAMFEALIDDRPEDVRVILRNIVDAQAFIACVTRVAEAFLSVHPQEERIAMVRELRELPPPTM